LYEAEAEAVVSENSAGSFGILAQHANFITMVQNKPIEIVIDKDKKRTFKFPLAIIYTTQNQVKIYTDILAQPSQKIF
jgi:F0F1-type ATP synthase epsilon subunit